MTQPLTATQMILELEAIIEEHGDLPIVLSWLHGQEPGPALEPEVSKRYGDGIIVIKAGRKP